MNSKTRILFAATVAAFAAACSSGGDSTLGGDDFGGSPRTPAATPAESPAPSKKDAGATQTPGTKTPPPTQPGTGPGSAGSAAHKYFVDNVFPKVTNCAACHASGAQGAPKFLAGSADEAYLALDSRGLIKPDSLLETKGPHAAGGAPALSADQKTAITAWLDLEAKERVGSAAPTNLLQVAALCGDPAKFPTQALTTLLTKQRTNENGNQCVGCNNTQCASCHTGDANVFISNGNTALNQQMIDFYKSPDTISRFVGIDGTKLVASNTFKIKSDATVADQRPRDVPKHPQFLLPAAAQTAIDAYAQDIVTKFAAGTCPKPTP